MKKQQNIIRGIGFLFFLFVYFVSPLLVSAVACTGLPSIGDLSLSNCILTVAGTTGSDQASNIEGSTANTANLLLSTGASVTINATGTLVVGSISPQGGSIAIENGGQIKLNTPLYIPDADADGWASDFSTVYTATSAGRRRLSLMRSTATADCGDSTYATNNVCCTVATRYQDADADTYGNPSVSISACTTAGYVDNNTDCNDASASVFRSVAGYLDSDGDGYGAGAYTTCAGATGSYIANNADCNDASAGILGPHTANTERTANFCNGACNQTRYLYTATECADNYYAANTLNNGCSPSHTANQLRNDWFCNGSCNMTRYYYSSTECADTYYASHANNNGCSPSWTYYRDADGDGYGSASSGTTTCCSGTCPGGYVSNNSDCNDGTSAIRTTNVSGGSITTSGGDKIHTFTGSGTLTVSCPGSLSVQALVVAGGGGGAGGYWSGVGGGGGGGIQYSSSIAATGAISVTIGAGGAGSVAGQGRTDGYDGGNSIFGSITAIGGGGGGGGNTSYGHSGGSGGGGGSSGGGAGSQGYNGGIYMGPPYRGGGGGGAGGGGGNGDSGVGGSGAYYTISGVGQYYAGGGGGGGSPSWSGPGSGGAGGGSSGDGPSGTPNTGGGGGGGSGQDGWYTIGGAAGGSGIVIIRYANP